MKKVIHIARAIVRHNGKILVLQNRSDHRNDWEAGHWEVPGGFVDGHDDTSTETLCREVREETGLAVTVTHALERVIVVEDETWFDCQYFLAEADERTVELSEEHQAYEWISPEAFKDLDWSRHAGYTIPVLQGLKDDS